MKEVLSDVLEDEVLQMFLCDGVVNIKEKRVPNKNHKERL